MSPKILAAAASDARRHRVFLCFCCGFCWPLLAKRHGQCPRLRKAVARDAQLLFGAIHVTVFACRRGQRQSLLKLLLCCFLTAHL